MTGFDLSWRFIRVWQRNLRVYSKIWKISCVPHLLEPLLYLAAFGVGLGRLVGDLSYGDRMISYSAFIAPALIAVSIMQSAFSENTYGSFVRMNYQKTFDAMRATPLTIEEITTGEIIWGATRSVIGAALMMVIISLFGLLHYPHALLLLPTAFLGGLVFACAGMICTAIVPAIDALNLPRFLFITPMFLCSGTFFPLDKLPAWAQLVAQALPLTHLAELCRSLAAGQLSAGILPAAAWLVVWSVVLFPVAIVGIRRRLVR